MNFQFRYLLAVTCSVLLFGCDGVSEQINVLSLGSADNESLAKFKFAG